MLQHPKSTPTKLDNDGPTVLVVEDSGALPVCTENLIRVAAVMESRKLTE
jgi:hypothetical protein